MLFRSVHVPTGQAAHVRPGTMPHAAWSSYDVVLEPLAQTDAASGLDFAYHALRAARCCLRVAFFTS
jgi:hypothetical protein